MPQPGVGISENFPSTHRYPKFFFWPVPGTHRYPKFFFGPVPGTHRYPKFFFGTEPGTHRYPKFFFLAGTRYPSVPKIFLRADPWPQHLWTRRTTVPKFGMLKVSVVNISFYFYAKKKTDYLQDNH